MSEQDRLYTRARSLQNAGRAREALDLYRQLARTVVTVNLACDMALCLAATGELDEALTWFRMAQAHRPDSPVVQQTSLSLCGSLLMAGRYRDGWPLMETRSAVHPDLAPPVRVDFPEWKGEPVAGKSILVWVEQGFGDQIMLVRFARQLAQGGARVTLACRPPLAPLFAEIEGLHAVLAVAKNQRVSVGRYDYWSRYFSLPHHLGTTLADIPAAPYLRAPADRRERWRGHSGIGVMWRTSATGANAGAKTLPEAQARRLLDLGATSLQPEDTGVADFADTAAIIEQLELVISVDTSVAHLAGAMGKPCWTLLPAQGLDWRWMRDRPDSPWYPSMRLFRQQQAGEWDSTVDEVLAAVG